MTRGVAVGSGDNVAPDETGVVVGGGGAVTTGVPVGSAARIGGAAVGRGVAVGGGSGVSLDFQYPSSVRLTSPHAHTEPSERSATAW